MGNIVWKSNGGTSICANVGEFRATVEAVNSPNWGARYLIYRKPNKSDLTTLLCSVFEAHVQTAMDRAEQIIGRHAGPEGT